MIERSRPHGKEGGRVLLRFQPEAGEVRGAYKARKPSLSKDQAAQLRQRALVGEKKAVLAREFGVSRETIYAYLRGIKS